METRYETLLDELHTNKRELANYRQKYLSLESQSLALQDQNRALKKSLDLLKQNNRKLSEQVKFLSAEKQALLNDYSANIESIKEQIGRKQLQLMAFKGNSCSPLMTHKLLQQQLRTQLQTEFEKSSEHQEATINQLRQEVQRLGFEKSLLNQKSQLSIKTLQKELQQLQNKQILNTEALTQRAFLSSQLNAFSEEKSLVKKLRRQIDELRLALDHTQQQLNQSITEKSHLQKEYSIFMTKHKSQVEKYAEQVRVMQVEKQKSSQKNIQQASQRENSLIRDKEKQIRSLKDQIEHLHQQLAKSHQTISQIQLESVAKTNEINRLKQSNYSNENEKFQQLRNQKQTMQREINQLRKINETLRQQNMSLLNAYSNFNIKNIPNPNHQLNLYKSQNQNQVPDPKQGQLQPTQGTHIENIKTNQLDKSFGNLTKVKSATNLHDQKLSKINIQNLYQGELFNHQELSRKYVELKKKYKNLESKFNKANSKLIQLLKDKIQIGSPTAASKKSFNFNSQINHINSPGFHHQREESQSPHASNEKEDSKIRVNLSPSEQQKYFSAQSQVRVNRTEKLSSSKGKASFYEKSLKVRSSHKLKQVKCLNHEDSFGHKHEVN